MTECSEKSDIGFSGLSSLATDLNDIKRTPEISKPQQTKKTTNSSGRPCGNPKCIGKISDNGRCGYCGKTFEQGLKASQPESYNKSHVDGSERKPCGDPACTGVIHENGLCGYCGLTEEQAVNRSQNRSQEPKKAEKKSNLFYVISTLAVILFIPILLLVGLTNLNSSSKKNKSPIIAPDNYIDKHYESKKDHLIKDVLNKNLQATVPFDSSIERYYVTTQKLNVREKPNTNAKIIGSLSKFDTVNVHSKSIADGWGKIKKGSFEGWVAQRYLAKGDGKAAKQSYYRAHVIRPANGHILFQKEKGLHSLIIKNGPGDDVIAKLKDRNGHLIISFYVRENQQCTIDSIPDGTYKFQYATGKSYCSVCGGIFLDNMQASEDTSYQKYQITVRDYGKYTTVMEYTLYRVTNGNLQTKRVPLNQF